MSRKQIENAVIGSPPDGQEPQSSENREERRDRQLASMIREGQEEFGLITGKRRPSGLASGEFNVPEDFDAPLPEDILRLFEDGPLFPSEPTC